MRRFPIIGAAALLSLSSSAYGQEDPDADHVPLLCGDRNEIVMGLVKEFKEDPQAVGIVNQHVIVEIFTSQAGTWTILATGTDGKSCLVTSGEGWDAKITLVPGVDS